MTENVTAICNVCHEAPADEDFKTCTACREKLREKWRKQAIMARERKARMIREETERRERERQAVMCASCAFKVYVGDHRFTCPSAYGTCIREDRLRMAEERRKEMLAKEQEEQHGALRETGGDGE